VEKLQLLYCGSQAVVHVMSNFKEIETCLECSAKNLVFVAEVIVNWDLTLRRSQATQRC
jgi:hypothetical protein